MANYYLNHYHEDQLKAAFPNLSSWVGRQLLDASQAIWFGFLK
jgi:hypothetical protein